MIERCEASEIDKSIDDRSQPEFFLKSFDMKVSGFGSGIGSERNSFHQESEIKRKL